MNNFKSYSFSRLINHLEIEFYFILGLPEPDNFSEYYDLTGHQVVGYLVMYKKHKKKETKNLIYLLPNTTKNENLEIKRHTHHFIQRMTTADMYDYDVEFKIQQTKIKGKSVGPPYIDFVKTIVGNDIPIEILREIKY